MSHLLLLFSVVLAGAGAGACNGPDSGPTPSPPPTASTTASTTPVTIPVQPFSGELSIDAPPTDVLVMTSPVDVSGRAPAAAGGVAVTAAGTSVAATQTGEAWQAQVTLANGLNEVVARQNTLSSAILLTLGRGIGQQPPQRFRLAWEEGVDDELRAIARGTLDHPTNANVEAFVVGVRQLVPLVVLRAFEGFAVTEADSDGPDVHTISLLPNRGSIFGQSPEDCGSRTPRQTTEVWVGTYREEMVQSFDAWRPMQKTDSLPTRIEDVAEALGRTSAHEMGHSLGLVGSSLGAPCGWMRGCDGGHNCSALGEQFPAISNRFDFGRYIMDPGQRTSNHARIAEPLDGARASVRTPSVFNPFNRGYLGVVHPTP